MIPPPAAILSQYPCQAPVLGTRPTRPLSDLSIAVVIGGLGRIANLTSVTAKGEATLIFDTGKLTTAPVKDLRLLTDTEAFLDGLTAFALNVTLDQCPHAPGWKQEAWIAGWYENYPWRTETDDTFDH